MGVWSRWKGERTPKIAEQAARTHVPSAGRPFAPEGTHSTRSGPWQSAGPVARGLIPQPVLSVCLSAHSPRHAALKGPSHARRDLTCEAAGAGPRTAGGAERFPGVCTVPSAGEAGAR